MIKRPSRHNRNRTALTPPNHPPGAAVSAVATIDGANARLTFSAPVVVRSLALGITRQAAGAGPQLLPTAYNVVSPQIVDLTYAAAVVATDVLTIPANVTEIRGVAGGQIAAAITTF